MTRTRTRLLVGALTLALPLGAAAGCGVEKRRTIKAELASATQHIKSSKAVSLTVRFDDTKGNLAALAYDDKSTPKAVSKAILGGSVSFTVDPAGSTTLQQLPTKGTSDADIKSAIKKVNAAIVVRDDQSIIGELRLVDGSLYAHVDLAEINRLAKLNGSEPVDDALDNAFGDDPTTAKALADVRAGKWLKIPIADYIDRFKDLAKSFTPGDVEPQPKPKATAQPDFNALGDRLLKAVKPSIKVTDANNSTSNRVLDIKVRVRPALKAALAVLKATKDLPFASQLKTVDDAAIDKAVADGTAHGTISLSNGHLKQVAIDLESFRTLDPKPGTKTLQGASVIFDVDDSAAEVPAPTDVSSFDIGELLDSFLSGFDGQQAT